MKETLDICGLKFEFENNNIIGCTLSDGEPVKCDFINDEKIFYHNSNGGFIEIYRTLDEQYYAKYKGNIIMNNNRPSISSDDYTIQLLILNEVKNIINMFSE